MNALKQLKVRAGEPPADGQEYLAFGNLIYEDGCVTCVSPFCDVIKFGPDLWRNRRGLALIRSMDDKLHFHSHVAVADIEPGLAEKAVELFTAEHEVEA